MDSIKIGFIGLGGRGRGLLKASVLPQKKAEVVAVCDLYEDRVNEGIKIVTDAGEKAPKAYRDYHDVIADEDVNTIVIATAWESHCEIALAAMRAGKPVALEVGGAYSIEQCWELVNTYEETKTPFMMLENCCFGRREMMVLNMVKQGLFGEIVHCSGGYQHELRHEITFGNENRHYRLRNYLNRNCENYPTHELGPIAKVLDINHGNRMLSLTSTASKAVGLHEYIMENKSDDDFLVNAKFKQGDIVTTVIKCANGETITLMLDTTLPRYYSRGFTVRGTKGFYEEVTDSVFLDTKEDNEHHFDWRKYGINNAENYEEEYDHPVWKEYLKEGVHEGHDGMDWLEFKTFFDCLKNDKPMPVDVYDAVSWMAITALSEKSIATGSMPIEIPDFTRGKWLIPKAEGGFLE